MPWKWPSNLRIFGFRVYPRAMRMAPMVASVPLLAKRIFSAHGTASDDHVGQAGVVFGLSVADDADIQRLQDGRPDGGVVVAQEVGAAAREEVDVFFAVHVPEAGAFAAGQVERPLEQRVHAPARSRAADQVPLRRLVELLDLSWLTSHRASSLGSSFSQDDLALRRATRRPSRKTISGRRSARMSCSGSSASRMRSARFPASTVPISASSRSARAASRRGHPQRIHGTEAGPAHQDLHGPRHLLEAGPGVAARPGAEGGVRSEEDRHALRPASGAGTASAP